jgi:hypothetical protein
MESYKIVRIYHPSQNKNNRTVKTGLTLEEAQEHCQDDNTKLEGVYFDGYTEE